MGHPLLQRLNALDLTSVSREKKKKKASLVAQTVKRETRGSIPGSGRSLEKEMATHSSILARRIPWTEEFGRLQSMGSQRVRHD